MHSYRYVFRLVAQYLDLSTDIIEAAVVRQLTTVHAPLTDIDLQPWCPGYAESAVSRQSERRCASEAYCFPLSRKQF